MPILTQDELDPLQAVRRVAEEYREAITAIYNARANAHVDAGFNDAENDRQSKIFEVAQALDTIYDAVSELEFEEEQPPEVAEAEDEDPEDDEDSDEEEEEE